MGYEQREAEAETLSTCTCWSATDGALFWHRAHTHARTCLPDTTVLRAPWCPALLVSAKQHCQVCFFCALPACSWPLQSPYADA
jgi:hypothetical protein